MSSVGGGVLSVGRSVGRAVGWNVSPVFLDSLALSYVSSPFVAPGGPVTWNRPSAAPSVMSIVAKVPSSTLRTK